ncbi:sulfurtransferase TusA family protein [Lutibaculum baratangense]|nr:sulfurtransferase TusA family protein [Lutibaculum baratangense]
MAEETQLDVKGLLCPLPVLKARKALSALPSGAVLAVEATDPAAVIDVPHFCNESGHELVSQDETDGVYVFRIRRK